MKKFKVKVLGTASIYAEYEIDAQNEGEAKFIAKSAFEEGIDWEFDCEQIDSIMVEKI